MMFLLQKKIVLLILFLFCLFLCIYAIKCEIGHHPSDQQLFLFKKKKYLGIAYFYQRQFHNIFNPIYDFKIPSEKEDNTKEFNFFKMLFKQYKKDNNNLTTIQLSRQDFKNNIVQDACYWLGHSSLILELEDKRIIIDPVFDNASPIPFFFSRYNKSPIKRKNLPKIDYVLITHNHYDHLERKTIQYLKKQSAYFIVPLGLKATLLGWGVKEDNIIELGWGEKFNAGKVIFNAEPTLHFSQRSLNDRNKTLWNSYILQTTNKDCNSNKNKIKKQIFIAGDGGYGEHIKIISDKYKKFGKFNLIAVEIDAWNVRWPELHMFPRENIEVIKQFDTEYFLPVHYGVFQLGMHNFGLSLDMLLKEAKIHGIEKKILTPKLGERILI